MSYRKRVEWWQNAPQGFGDELRAGDRWRVDTGAGLVEVEWMPFLPAPFPWSEDKMPWRMVQPHLPDICRDGIYQDDPENGRGITPKDPKDTTRRWYGLTGCVAFIKDDSPEKHKDADYDRRKRGEGYNRKPCGKCPYA